MERFIAFRNFQGDIMNKKLKAASIAAVKLVVEAKINQKAIYPLEPPTSPSAWTQNGKQLQMINRNIVQLKLGRKV